MTARSWSLRCPPSSVLAVRIIFLYSCTKIVKCCVVLCRPVRHRPHRSDCAWRQLPAAARLPLAPLPQPGGHGELPRAGRHRAALHRAAAAHLALPRGPRLAVGQPRLVAVSLHGLAGEPSPGAGPADADEGRPGGLRGLGPGQAGQKLCAAVSSSHRYIRKGISCFLILNMCVCFHSFYTCDNAVKAIYVCIYTKLDCDNVLHLALFYV